MVERRHRVPNALPDDALTVADPFPTAVSIAVSVPQPSPGTQPFNRALTGGPSDRGRIVATPVGLCRRSQRARNARVDNIVVMSVDPYECADWGEVLWARRACLPRSQFEGAATIGSDSQDRVVGAVIECQRRADDGWETLAEPPPCRAVVGASQDARVVGHDDGVR